MQASLSLEKERMKFKGDGKKILVPLRGKMEMTCEFVEDVVIVEEIYRKIIEEDHEPNDEGEIPLSSPTSLADSDQRIYEWQMQQYELGRRDYFSIQFIPKTNLTTNGKELREARYVGAGEPKLHLRKIEKSAKKESKLNTLTKSFAGVAARWWKGHKT